MHELNEEERRALIDPFNNELLEGLRKAGLYELTLKYWATLGGISNTLGNPIAETAIVLTRKLIVLSRQKSISENDIRVMVELSLERRQKIIAAGFELQPVNPEDLFSE